MRMLNKIAQETLHRLIILFAFSYVFLNIVHKKGDLMSTLSRQDKLALSKIDPANNTVKIQSVNWFGQIS